MLLTQGDFGSLPSSPPTAPSAPSSPSAASSAPEHVLATAQAQRSLAAAAALHREESEEFDFAEGTVIEALARTAEEAEMLEGDPLEVRYTGM